MKDPLSLPFDTYQRYRLVADVLGELRKASGDKKRGLRVLDVGGRTAVLRAFDDADDVALVDLEPNEGVPGLVLGDGTRLPFADRAFDVVCAFDTLEHVPPERRDAFVDECARVASRWVILAGPYNSPEVVRAELTLQRFLKEKLDYEHRYLEEHRHHGLPERAAVEARLRAAGANVRSLGHANLDRWLIFLCVSFYLDLEPKLRDLAAQFFRFYNASLYASDHAPPVYRHAVVAALRGAPLPSFDGLLAPPVAPAGALAPFAELAQELCAFDRVRSDLRAEALLLRETIRTLETDLAGHRDALSEAKATIDEKVAAIAALEAHFESELAAHRGTIEALEAEVAARDREVTRLGRELDLAAAERERLTHEAGAEAARAADLARQLARERREVEERDAEIGRLGGELAAEKALAEALRHTAEKRALVLADRERDLAGHREVLAARERELEDQRVHIGHLEAHLRDRNAELKRWPMAALRRVMWLFFGRPPTA